MSPAAPLIAAGFAVALAVVWTKWRRAARAQFIRSHVFPMGLFEKLRKQRPELTLKDCQLVGQALRQFFLAYLNQQFCRRGFGGFLHHTPAAVLGSNKRSNDGLRRCWWHVCREENINPRNPTRLPLLFALDAKLNIADGFRI